MITINEKYWNVGGKMNSNLIPNPISTICCIALVKLLNPSELHLPLHRGLMRWCISKSSYCWFSDYSSLFLYLCPALEHLLGKSHQRPLHRKGIVQRRCWRVFMVNIEGATSNLIPVFLGKGSLWPDTSDRHHSTVTSRYFHTPHFAAEETDIKINPCLHHVLVMMGRWAFESNLIPEPLFFALLSYSASQILVYSSLHFEPHRGWT